LLFAPYGNSYARFAEQAHAPVSICWGHENRTVAVRIPGGDPKVRRIEHRVSGGDINPYLMLAVILGAALAGLEDRAEPAAPITGNAYDADLPQLAESWGAAIEAFETSSLMSRVLPKNLIENLVMTKRQEMQVFAGMTDDEVTSITLDSV
jgi:glutamine synthetase